MSGRFQGKTAIVTGSSNGIGRAIAVLFAKEGAQVTIAGRDEHTLQITQSLMLEAGANLQDIAEVLGDLREENVRKELIEKTLEKFGKIDILVNNAGGSPPQGLLDLESVGIDAFDYTFDLNIRSIVCLCQMALPHLANRKGEIVMISSIAALPFANKQYAFYAMSKSALDQYTRSLAIHAIERSVRVNSVSPGLIRTDIFHKMGISEENCKAFLDKWENDSAKIPIGRTGIPEDIAKAVAFLADRSISEFMVGSFLIVDGGTHLMNSAISAPIAADFQ